MTIVKYGLAAIAVFALLILQATGFINPENVESMRGWWGSR